VTVSDYFYLHFVVEEGLATARAPYDFEVSRRLMDGNEVTDWEPLRFELDEGAVVDYLANTFAYRLCSERLRDVLEGGRGAPDVVQWLSAIVVDQRGRELPYWVLHFPTVPQVLNRSRSLLAGPMVVKAVLDRQLIDGHRLLTLPKDLTTLMLADQVKSAIEAAGCTGMKFSPIPMA
jgi:hypothetical protein